MGVDCASYPAADSVSLGKATFCGSNDSGTEQHFYLVKLGFASLEAKKTFETFSCTYPNHGLRIVAPMRPGTEIAPEAERISGIQAGLFLTVPLQAGTEWQTIQQNEYLAVDVERRVYIGPGGRRLLIHVRISNKTQGELAVDLRSRDLVVYPNLWQLHRATERPEICEVRGSPMRLDAGRTARMLADFRADRLTQVKESVEYYYEFLGRRPNGADYSGNERYITISTDGQLLFTDGRMVGSLDLQWREGFGPRQTDMVIPVPFVTWMPSAGINIL